MISGYFGLDFVIPMPAVCAYVVLPGIVEGAVAIDFLLDTGSTSTLLHPRDAKTRIEIDPDRLASPDGWAHRRTIGSVGGAATAYIWPATYYFEHDDGTIRRVTHEIDIVRPSPGNATLPSILGMDISRQFRVLVDYVGQTVSLY